MTGRPRHASGPIAVEEARAGDTLEVRILHMERVPLRPHPGVMGVAPAEVGHHNSIPPGRSLAATSTTGASVLGVTMYYPIMVDQALFYIGDPHMAEGDGELSGTAIEASANVWLQLIVRNDVTHSPVLETPSHWYTHGFIVCRPQQYAPARPSNVGAPPGDLNAADAHGCHGDAGVSDQTARAVARRCLRRLSVAADFGITQVVVHARGRASCGLGEISIRSASRARTAEKAMPASKMNAAS